MIIDLARCNAASIVPCPHSRLLADKVDVMDTASYFLPHQQSCRYVITLISIYATTSVGIMTFIKR